VVVFGHSHNPLVLNLNGVLLDPGSSTDKLRQAQYSLGLLSLKKRPEAKLLWFD
jgi:predicted phosphodiesterase